MKNLLVRRSAVGLALGALAATGLASVAAPAQAVVTNTTVYASAGSHDDASCTWVGTEQDPGGVPWTDNSVPISQSVAASGTVTGAPGDVTALSSSGATTVTASPLGSGPATIQLTANGAAKSTPALPASACKGHAYASGGVESDFTLAQPMWATLAVKVVGTGSTGTSLTLNLPDGQVRLDGAGSSNGTVTAYLPAGAVDLDFDWWVDAHGEVPAQRSSSISASVKIDLQPMGAASAVAGKGSGYVQFGARDCGTSNVAAAITKKAKKKAEQVLIKVNGAKVAKFKGKKLKKRALVLPAAPAAEATVEATIKLKNGKKVTVTRSYLACS
ncbi:hypothetical protein [Nocardioides nitrophenolicus]|uniref:hypothetical protein n=1 Tax=Nocardioides nitrophenolicus TaxID=60489 RepID=UPI00195A4546|nr:hypothetical protein [Nocardioides nitrophenolicus]MBM7518355.1 hypothetical protein [Nocardioides nitrophenolicus]